MFRDFFSPIIKQIRGGNEQIINQIKEGQKLYSFQLTLHLPLIEPNDDKSPKKRLILEEDVGEEYLMTHIYLNRSIHLSYVPPIGSWLDFSLTENSIGSEFFEVLTIKTLLNEDFKDYMSVILTKPKQEPKRLFEESHLNKQKVEDSIDQFETFGWKITTYKDH